MRLFLTFIIALLPLAAVATAPVQPTAASPVKSIAIPIRHITPGIEVLLSDRVAMLKGKRVALLTNQTGVDRKGISDIDLLRAHPEVFDQRIGTYDVRTSGLGYLFATQDSRNTDSFWRLTEVMGRLNTQLYCCSGAMIDDVYQGRLVLAYNVLGSYAENRLAHEPGITIVPMQDYVTVMMRTAFIPQNAQYPDVAGRMIDFLLSKPTQESLAETTGLPPVFDGASDKQKALRPIRLGPGLLVFLDLLKRQAFLRNWENSIRQE